MNLTSQVDRIGSRQDFVAFLCRLVSDFQNHPEEWENQKLDLYLEAIAAWVEDMDGYYENAGEHTPDRPDWKTLGQMMLAGKYYE